MVNRSGSESRRLNLTTSIRWDETSYADLVALADVNGRSVGEIVRWLVGHASRNLPRTQELSAELIQTRIALNLLARALTDWSPVQSAKLNDLISEIESIIRALR